ncbi:MAG: replication/repair protein RecF [Nocardioidaceae bacterium]|nr:replication/repair protein RecF [Nocardioidaceae bacterium]
MHVAALSLHNFRSYESAEVVLEAGSTAFIGANGQGKTNLVEAIDYLATLGSHRVASDTPLVRVGSEQAVVRASVVKNGRTALLDVEINPGKSNRARINKSPLTRARDLVGILRTVVFSPEDLALVKGDPADRRHFLDALMALRTPRLAGVKSDYDRVLKQRNALLKSAGRRFREAGEAPSTLEVWNEHLCQLGSELLAARLNLLDDLQPYLDKSYAQVAAGAAQDRQRALATYKPSCVLGESKDPADLALDLARAIEERRRDELDRGISLVGPQRDDVTLTLGEMPAKGYASHGESWSFALALKLASFELLRADGDDPVLILDDVFAELDRGRREQLAHLVADAEQVLVTAAVAADVPEELLGQRFTVADGEVRHDG